MDKFEYKNKISAMLGDSETYTIIKKDPNKTLTRNVRDLLSRWKRDEYILTSEYKKLYYLDGLLRAYGLSKIHKPGCPLRIIIFSIDSPLYSLASFLQNIISNDIHGQKSMIENSFQLVDKLKDTHIENNFILISLDMISFYQHSDRFSLRNHF